MGVQFPTVTDIQIHEKNRKWAQIYYLALTSSPSLSGLPSNHYVIPFFRVDPFFEPFFEMTDLGTAVGTVGLWGKVCLVLAALVVPNPTGVGIGKALVLDEYFIKYFDGSSEFVPGSIGLGMVVVRTLLGEVLHEFILDLGVGVDDIYEFVTFLIDVLGGFDGSRFCS